MRDVSKQDILSMDTANLTKFRNIIRDRWTWETGTDEDKELLDIIETELTMREAQPSSRVDFQIRADTLSLDNHTLFEITGEYNNPIGLSSELKKSIKKSLVDDITSYNYEGYNLGEAIVNKINEELDFNLRSKLETMIRGIVYTEIFSLEDRIKNIVKDELNEYQRLEDSD